MKSLEYTSVRVYYSKRHDKTLLSFWSAKKVCSNDDTVSDEDENLFETESESDNNVSEADEDVLQTSKQSSSRQVYKIITSSGKHTLSLQFN